MAARGRRLVVGFGHRSCGWASTADLVNYEIKRRRGEYESSFVSAAGRLQYVIVVSSDDEGTALRETLNSATPPAVHALVVQRALPHSKTEALRILLDRACASHAETGERQQDLSDTAWAVVDASDRSAASIVAGFVVPATRGPTVPQWDDPAAFPFAAVVFDLDQTLVDSSLLATADAKRAWAEGADISHVKSFGVDGAVEPTDLPRLLAERNVKVAIVTRAPLAYAERVLHEFSIQPDVIKAGRGDKAAKTREAAHDLGVRLDSLVIIGDDESDVHAARDVGAVSLGVLWGTPAWDDRVQPDITCAEPELLLEVADWHRLGFLGEQTLEQTPRVHVGSSLSYGEPKRQSLGRYFRTQSVRHQDALTQAVLEWKNRSEPHPMIERGLNLFGVLVNGHAKVDVVTSIPPKAERVDRFSKYREVAATALSADAASVIQTKHEIPGYKNLRHDDRRGRSSGRFGADPSVEGMHVLVLDDIHTSGATFDAAEEALFNAGAAKVTCLSFSATQD